MTDTYKTLYQGYLPTTAGALYTVPNGPTALGAIVKHMTVVNVTGAAATFQLFRNGTAASNAITPSSMTVPANGLMEWDGTDAYLSADSIQGIASASNTLLITIDGDQVS